MQGIALISLTAKELNEAVRKEAAENPALETIQKPYSAGGGGQGTHTGAVTHAGEEAAEKYQAAYENVAEDTETLQEHLLFQLDMMHLTPDDAALGERLIRNLDKNGYHILDPAALPDKRRPAQTEEALLRMMSVIQHFDPEGTCCNNMEESLLVQARIKAEEGKRGVPPLALFILDGHIDTLYSNTSALDTRLILRRLKKLQEERRSLSFAAPSEIDNIALDEDGVKKAVSFISSLNPRPASFFASEPTAFALPDVVVKKMVNSDSASVEDVAGTVSSEDGKTSVTAVQGKDGRAASKDGKKEVYSKVLTDGGEQETVEAGGVQYSIALADGYPSVRLSRDFKAVRGHEAAVQRLRAKSFIENLNYRAHIILKASSIIIKRQASFFNTNGKAALEPFTQAELSNLLDVATSTTSRMVTAKYIASPWGKLYPMSYFFTNGKSKAKAAIKEVLSTAEKGKVLSDRQIAQLLHERGINIARRTVAKYRAALNIQSSHARRHTMAGNRGDEC